MIEGDKSWIIWLARESGNTLLGLTLGDEDEDDSYRYAVYGEYQSDGPNGVGVWVNVQLVHRVAVGSNTLLQSWVVSPSSCLILWQHIAYVQRGPQSGTVGFSVQNSK